MCFLRRGDACACHRPDRHCSPYSRVNSCYSTYPFSATGVVYKEPQCRHRCSHSHYHHPLQPDRAVSRSPEPSCTLQTRVNPLLKNADHIIVDLSLPESEFSALMKKTHSKVIDATGISLQCEATNPIVKELQITCEEFGKFEKDWKISISSERTITVEFLLRAIHKAMRTQITCSEWNRMSDSEKAHVNKSYARRLGVSTAWSEPFGSVRRVDVLKDKFYFGGLKPEKDDDPKNFKLSVKEK